MRILLVEDNPLERELAIRSLRACGFDGTILAASDGAEAVELITRQDLHDLRLALVDLKLPKMDGLEVIRAIRTCKTTEHLPVVVFSSSDDRRDMEKSYLAGANEFVTKPMSFEGMKEALEKISRYWKNNGTCNAAAS